ncbi:MAG: hypothetical protein Kow0092_38660 [Deferrisomatales bacterium]
MRRRVEPALGASLAHVRVHDDPGAHRAARQLGARAFTHGRHIWLGAGQDAGDLALMAHEAAHVVQQGAARPRGALGPFAAGRPLVQRALILRGETGALLVLAVGFRGEYLLYTLPLTPELLGYFDADPDLAQRIEEELTGIFNPEEPLHETPEYLLSPAVRNLIVQGIGALEEIGTTDFRVLADLLRQRTALFQAQELLPDATDRLAEGLGIDPAALDWGSLLPDLLARARAMEPTTVLDASYRDRYEMVLEMLAREAAALDPVVGAAPVDLGTAEDLLWDYATSLGPEAFAEGTFGYHSEKFLADYLLLLEALRYVPEGFDLEAHRPEPDTSRADARREAMVGAFMREEAEGYIVRYILDDMTVSGRSPEAYLASVDFDALRDRLVAHLASVLMDRARGDREIMAVLRSRAGDEARFTQLAWLHAHARSMEAFNRGLWDLFANSPLEELTYEQETIATDPYAFYDMSLTVSEAMRRMFEAAGEGFFEREVVANARILLEELDVSGALAPVFLLPELLGYFRALERILAEQEEATRRSVEEQLDFGYPELVEVVSSYVDHAERFIRENWIPMLKVVATERVYQNLDELRHIDANWEALNRDVTAQFDSGARELEELADALEDGRYESVELEGRVIRRDGAAELRVAAATLRAAGIQSRESAEDADERREKIRGAIADYEQVIEDIASGDYDPLDYSAAVYAEARERLGIGHFEYGTVGQVLSREIVADRNPFLAWAITRWKFKEGLERAFTRALVLVALGILTLAAALVPGAIGVILGAIDIALGFALGAKDVLDAQAMLRMARLDVHGDIVGISEADAERALRNAWINLAATTVLTAGTAALRARSVVRTSGGSRFRRGARDIPMSGRQRALLARSGRKPAHRMTRAEMGAEIDVASRAPRRPSRTAGYVEEVDLPNGHTWRRRADGTWCRFSTRPGLCGIRFENWDRIAHGGWFTRKAWRRRIHTGEWSPHGNKHLRARSVADAQAMSRHGDSQYLPGIDNAALEREALFRGTVTRGVRSDPGSTVHVYYKFDSVVGYSEGQPTRWIRAEITSGGVYHGHPRSLRLVRRAIPDATP